MMVQKNVQRRLGAAVASAALASGACVDRSLEGTVVREFTGSQGERITETLSWKKGSETRNRQLDIVYSNGVHLRVVDVLDDGQIDNRYVAENPNEVYLVMDADPTQEIWRLPSDAELSRYLSPREQSQ